MITAVFKNRLKFLHGSNYFMQSQSILHNLHIMKTSKVSFLEDLLLRYRINIRNNKTRILGTPDTSEQFHKRRASGYRLCNDKQTPVNTSMYESLPTTDRSNSITIIFEKIPD